MFTTKPETFKKLSTEERTAYLSYFEEKLSELKNMYSELTENKEITNDCENEIDKLEETLWCLEYGFSSLYDYYGLNDITDIEPNINSKEFIHNYVDEKLQNKIISYLSFIEFVYNKLGKDIRRVMCFNALRPYFYPYICSTDVNYNKTKSVQINVFIYLLLKTKFKNLNHFIYRDLLYLNGYLDINNKPIKSKPINLNDKKTQTECLKNFFLSEYHSTDSLSEYFHRNVIYSLDFEGTLDTFMIVIFNENRYDEHLKINTFGYVVNDFRVPAKTFKKYFGISSKNSKICSLR